MKNTLKIEESLLQYLSAEEEAALHRLYLAEEHFLKTRTDNRNFSIAVTKHFSGDMQENTLVYVVNPEKKVPESNQCRCLYGIDAKTQAFCLAKQDFENRNRRVLLYLGKFPAYGFDIDGGSILAKQLIDSLKIRCDLHVVFIRKNEETFYDEQVGSITYVPYIDAWNHKFIRRMENLETNCLALKDYQDYDIIIAAHISKFFGLEKYDDSFWKKTVLFPMFCSQSYIKGGESVPQEYIVEEQAVITRVSRIITPSVEEANDLIADYQCNLKKITIIPRGISPFIVYQHRNTPHPVLRIVCIGTVKMQKNTKEVLKLMQKLESKGLVCELHLVCTIQERTYYEELCTLISSQGMQKKIIQHISISQPELAELLSQMDINVSMSRWETFGRGIFEGAAAGLPTFVFDILETVKRLSAKNQGIYFASSLEDMADAIFRTVTDAQSYSRMSQLLREIATMFSYKNEQNQLTETIFSVY